MNIKKYTFHFAVAFLAFGLGYAVCAEYRFVRSYFQSARLDRKLVPLAAMDVNALAPDEIYALPVASLTNATPTVDAESEPPPDFDPAGDYYLGEEKPPKGFEDFEYVNIVTHEYETETAAGVYGTPIVPTGSVQGEHAYKFKSVAVSPAYVAFETQVVKRINYIFVGEFPRKDVPESCDTEETPTLTGRLSKLRDGKRVATKKVSLYLQCGC